MRYSDLITTIRIILVAIFAAVLCFFPTVFGLVLGLIIIGIIFLTDSLDGYIARKKDEKSEYGAFYDIAGDRITETGLLVPLTYLGVANPLILLFFVVKNFWTDYKRLKQFGISGNVPFKQSNSMLFKILVSSRPLRAIYGISKMLMIFLFYALIFSNSLELSLTAAIVAVITIIFSVARTLPVFLG